MGPWKITEFIFEGPILVQMKPLKQINVIRQSFPCSGNTQVHSEMLGLNPGVSGSQISEMNGSHISLNFLFCIFSVSHLGDGMGMPLVPGRSKCSELQNGVFLE